MNSSRRSNENILTAPQTIPRRGEKFHIMKALNEIIKENEEILKDHFKRISLEQDKHITDITIELLYLNKEIRCEMYCNFRDCEEVEGWFKRVGEEGEQDLYNELKDRQYQSYYMDLKEALELIRIEGRDKKIDDILN